MNYLKVGYISKPHGLKGEVKILPLTNSDNRFKKIKKVYINLNEKYICLNIVSVKITPKNLIVKFSEFNKIEEVEKLRSKYVFIDRKEGEKLSDGEYYSQDLIGCDFIYEDKIIGKVKNFFNAGSCDIFLVDYQGNDIYYPFINDYIDNIDIQNKKITINEFESFFI